MAPQVMQGSTREISFGLYLLLPLIEKTGEFRNFAETTPMTAWRNTIGRISVIASAVILVFGATIEACKMGVKSGIYALTFGLSGRYIEFLNFDGIKASGHQALECLKVVPEDLIQDCFFTPREKYVAFWNLSITICLLAAGLYNPFGGESSTERQSR